MGGGARRPPEDVVEVDAVVFERPSEPYVPVEFWREACSIFCVETMRFVIPIPSMRSQASVRFCS